MNRDEILPDFMRREIEREIYAAEHPVGMSTHDGKAKIQATTLRRLMRLVAEIERLGADAEQWKDLATDAVSGLAYIREVHGDLYGVGWDRVFTKKAAIDKAMAEERKP